MPEIRGRYEYDDESLTPGRKREGGLHQNLYDSDGQLKANARFIPDDETDLPDGPTPSDDADERARETEAQRRAERDAELAALATEVLLRLIALGIVKAAPHVAAWWNNKVRPALRARWTRLVHLIRRRKRSIKLPGERIPVLMQATDDEIWQDLDTSAENQVDMSRSEAQARLLLAMAAQAFSDEQMRLVTTARIHEDAGFVELQRIVEELPVNQAAAALANLQADPSLFTVEALARLASRPDGEIAHLAIEPRREQ